MAEEEADIGVGRKNEDDCSSSGAILEDRLLAAAREVIKVLELGMWIKRARCSSDVYQCTYKVVHQLHVNTKR